MTSQVDGPPQESAHAVQTNGPLLARRQFLLAAAGLVVPLIAAGPALGHAGRSEAWTQAAHDLSASRIARRTPAGLSIRWRQPVVGGLTGPPLVVDHLVVAASLGGEVAVFDLETGRERWRRDLGPARYGSGDAAVSLGFFGGCAVADGRVVVASDRVRCLRLRDGVVLWEADALAPAGGDDYVWGAPVIACGLVLAGSGAATESTATRGRVSAYRLVDGAPRWSTPLVPEGANGGGVLSPVSVDTARETLFAGTGAPYLPQPGTNPGTSSVVELALHDGRLLWSDQIHPGDSLGLDVNSAPLLTRRVIAATSKDGVWAWNRCSRERIWQVGLTPATPSDGGPAGPVNGPEGGPIAGDERGFYVLSNDAGRALGGGRARPARGGGSLAHGPGRVHLRGPAPRGRSRLRHDRLGRSGGPQGPRWPTRGSRGPRRPECGSGRLECGQIGPGRWRGALPAGRRDHLRG